MYLLMVVAQFVITEVGQPEQRGSLQSSQLKMAGEFL